MKLLLDLCSIGIFWFLALASISFAELVPRVNSCVKIFNFRDAPTDFLTESVEYRGFTFDPRWRPWDCPKKFPIRACYHRTSTSLVGDCVRNTICSYDRATAGRINWSNPQISNISVPYQPRALFYRSDFEIGRLDDTPNLYAPRFRIRAPLSNNSFALHSITFSFPMREEMVDKRKARTIFVRGYENGRDGPGFEAKDLQRIVVPNPPLPLMTGSPPKTTSIPSSALNFTTLPAFQATEVVNGVIQITAGPRVNYKDQGVADHRYHVKFEFPHDTFAQWGNLVALEFSGYRYLVGEDETATVHVVPGVGEFMIKEMNITMGANLGGGPCWTPETA
ncbi:hypothetical protein ABW19_dt0207032 [Dactylella cylindrospora]|nr:hypothetical protein ABW19_dt0207032 [Dactylella cylindrospora]